MANVLGLNDAISKDLEILGLSITDIDARTLTVNDHEKLGYNHGILGYKIPYYDINGMPIRHARLKRVSDGSKDMDTSFININNDANYIYYPKNFKKIENRKFENYLGDKQEILVICDDERWACKLIKDNILSVSIAGCAGWRGVKKSSYAEGFIDIVEYIIQNDICVIFLMTSDYTKNKQQELALLGMELKIRGVGYSNLRQYKNFNGIEKVFDIDSLAKCMKPFSLFPNYPNIRDYIHTLIGNTPRISRDRQIRIGLAILSDLESFGKRLLVTSTGLYYFFNQDEHEIYPASLNSSGRELMQNNKFMKFLTNKYGLYQDDTSLLRKLGTLFTSEEPIIESELYRCLYGKYRHEDSFYYQLTDKDFVMIKDGKASITQNGNLGVMFTKGSTENLDLTKFNKYLEVERENKLNFKWLSVVNEMRIVADDKLRILTALLYYVSPWLMGWKGIQLPIELNIGEAKSGKTSIFQLRSEILLGRAEIKGAPKKVGDWEASVINSNGLLVYDNLHKASKGMVNMMSDDISKLFSDKIPVIEPRKLYSNGEIISFPINTTFCFTSIQEVFTATDFFDRTFITRFDTTQGDGKYIDWVKLKLEEFGGREAWVAHHIHVLELFFGVVKEEWNDEYQQVMRHINFEQTLMMMAKVFGIDGYWIPKTLKMIAKQNLLISDWVIRGLYNFALVRLEKGKTTFTSTDISNWALMNDEFSDNNILNSPQKLSRYISSRKHVVFESTGITRAVESKSTIRYNIDRRKLI